MVNNRHSETCYEW